MSRRSIGRVMDFRAGRSCHTAITEARQHVEEGYEWTVDIDLERFFDRVPHQRLMARLAQRVSDRRLLVTIGRMLKAKVVLSDGVLVSTEEGVPQGGPLSPLLSNIVLDELDQELARRGHRFVRYADDCNVYVRSERAGQRVMASLTRFIEGRLRLKVNREKSAVAPTGERHPAWITSNSWLFQCCSWASGPRVKFSFTPSRDSTSFSLIRNSTSQPEGSSQFSSNSADSPADRLTFSPKAPSERPSPDRSSPTGDAASLAQPKSRINRQDRTKARMPTTSNAGAVSSSAVAHQVSNLRASNSARPNP